MINYIKGRLTYKGSDFIVVENNGIGYKIFVSKNILASLGYGEVQIYTYMNVSENDISLYGFSTSEELNLFFKLITVSGVGPKSAIGLLSTLSPSDIIFAIISEDVKALLAGQGIGKKTAQRIILELKDKISGDSAFANTSAASDIVSAASSAGEAGDAIEALTALGFTRSEATKAVSAVYTSGMTTEETLKASLKALSK